MDKKIKIKIAVPFLLIALGASAAWLIDFPLSLDRSESKLEKFKSEKLEMPIKTRKKTAGFKNPFDVITAKQVVPANPAAALLDMPVADSINTASLLASSDVKVSVIVIGNKNRVAIINGSVVREGDKLGRITIEKIERERVLVTENMTKKWIHLEEKS